MGNHTEGAAMQKDNKVSFRPVPRGWAVKDESLMEKRGLRRLSSFEVIYDVDEGLQKKNQSDSLGEWRFPFELFNTLYGTVELKWWELVGIQLKHLESFSGNVQQGFSGDIEWT